MKRTTKIGTDIFRAADELRKGELVAIPTETVYGLAGNALERDSVVKIFEAKNRPQFDPLIVHTHSSTEFEKYAEFDPVILKWINQLSPGPITYILKKKSIIPDLVTSGHDTVGLRVPNHPLTLELLKSLDFPLAAPSANPFGYVSPTRASHVKDQLNGKLPYILDGGSSQVGIESTIIDLSGDKPAVLRLGGFELSELEKVFDQKLEDIRLSSSQPNAPGMLHSHYAPGVELSRKSILDLKKLHPDKRIGALRFSSFSPDLEESAQLILSPSGTSAEAAQRLFLCLRELDSKEWDIVSVEFAPEDGLGMAINDRLTRATHPQ